LTLFILDVEETEGASPPSGEQSTSKSSISLLAGVSNESELSAGL